MGSSDLTLSPIGPVLRKNYAINPRMVSTSGTTVVRRNHVSGVARSYRGLPGAWTRVAVGSTGTVALTALAPGARCAAGSLVPTDANRAGMRHELDARACEADNLALTISGFSYAGTGSHRFRVSFSWIDSSGGTTVTYPYSSDFGAVGSEVKVNVPVPSSAVRGAVELCVVGNPAVPSARSATFTVLGVSLEDADSVVLSWPSIWDGSTASHDGLTYSWEGETGASPSSATGLAVNGWTPSSGVVAWQSAVGSMSVVGRGRVVSNAPTTRPGAAWSCSISAEMSGLIIGDVWRLAMNLKTPTYSIVTFIPWRTRPIGVERIAINGATIPPGGVAVELRLDVDTRGGVIVFRDALLENAPFGGSFFSGSTTDTPESTCSWVGTPDASPSLSQRGRYVRPSSITAYWNPRKLAMI